MGDNPMITMPVQPAYNNGGSCGGWGGWGNDGGLFLIVLFLFAFCGWGGNGFGRNNGNGMGVMDGYTLTSDFANLERKLDGVNNGLCDGFYAQAQLINGLQQTVNNGFMTAELSKSNQQAALMQQLFDMQRQAAECCCENRQAVAQVRYDMATQACDTRNTVQNTTRDIIDAMTAGFNGINQRMTAQEIAAKDEKIAEQNQQLFAAQLAASQAAQNNYLINTLRPIPTPAYQSCNPWASNTPFGACGACA